MHYFWPLGTVRVPLGQVIDDPADENLYLIFEGLPGRQLMDWNENSCTYSARSAGCTSERPSGDSHSDILVFREGLAKHFARQLAEGVAYIHSLGVMSREVPADGLCRLDVSGWPQLKSPDSKDAGKARAPGDSARRQLVAAAMGPLESAGGVRGAGGQLRFAEVVKIADFNCAEECPGPNFEIFDAQGGWSMGCVLFVLVYGRCPFWAEENLLLQLQIMQCTPLVFHDAVRFGESTHASTQL
eukprot:Skav221040  [mRNA]  locus=scaffold1448:167805:170899:+ [translate_table: standard]